MPSVISWTISFIELSSSMACQHSFEKWLGRPHDWQVLPYAGHCAFLMAVLDEVPCPCRPLKLHVPLSVVLGGVAWGRSVKGFGTPWLCWRCCRLYPLFTASSRSAPSSRALVDGVVGAFSAMEARFPVAFFSTKRRVCSTVIRLVASSMRSSWMSGSAMLMHSWSDTLLSLWSTMWSQLVHRSWNSHVSAMPLNRDSKDLYDSPLSCVMRANANVATV